MPSDVTNIMTYLWTDSSTTIATWPIEYVLQLSLHHLSITATFTWPLDCVLPAPEVNSCGSHVLPAMIDSQVVINAAQTGGYTMSTGQFTLITRRAAPTAFMHLSPRLKRLATDDSKIMQGLWNLAWSTSWQFAYRSTSCTKAEGWSSWHPEIGVIWRLWGKGKKGLDYVQNGPVGKLVSSNIIHIMRS